MLEDVRNDYVSVERALIDYGVVIDPAEMTVDEAATAAARRRSTVFESGRFPGWSSTIAWLRASANWEYTTLIS